MAAAKTSMVLFLVALMAISANLQMGSAVGVDCSTGLALELNLFSGQCTSDIYCKSYCNNSCDLEFKTTAVLSVCALHPLLGAIVKVCTCCCASL
ncbi:hypothetical protein C5167_040468 [Papaver somniferum]|uniref:Defensin-like protein n=1 Tax=Papaver somniferum TaxID=3469 RepID=A0A4Y7IF47_PAPSO|nr:hypothetical protein C5167_040468 [Papaver somniferum]